MTQENNPNQPASPHAQLFFLLARAFWLAFNHLSMYGPGHPLGRQAVQDCRRRLQDVLAEMPHVTLHLERGGLYCNMLRIDRELRLERLSDRLSQAGIEALTFIPGVTEPELLLLFSMLVNSKEYRGLAEIRAALPEKHVFYNRLVQRAREKVFVAGGDGEAESGKSAQSASGPVPLVLEQKPMPSAEPVDQDGTAPGRESFGTVEPLPAAGAKKRLKAPKGMLSARETKAVIEAEIYRAGRYEVPYSVITFSLEGKRTGLHGETAALEDQEFLLALQLLADEFRLLLRHLDRIGTLAPLRRNQFVLSLPMTPISGALLLMERLEKKYSEWIISLDRGVLLPVLIFSTFTFSFKKPPGVSLFIRQVKRRHGQKKKIMAEQGLI